MFLSVWEVVRTMFGAGRCLSVRDPDGTMSEEMLLGCKGKLKIFCEFFWVEMFSGVCMKEKV
jgi:hypothetical protein